LIALADLHGCRLSTDPTVPTTTPYLYTGRSSVELNEVLALWNKHRHGRIRALRPHHQVHLIPENPESPENAKDPTS
jgi:hypothetical protein